MQAKTERFEMRLDESILTRVDAWRAAQSDLPSRAEAVRRLVDSSLGNSSAARGVQISDGEKLIIAMLGEVYKHLKIKGEIEPNFILATLYGGHYWGLKYRYSGLLHDYESSNALRDEVTNILDMWSFIEHSVDKLAKADRLALKNSDIPFAERVRFPGFDWNNELEYHSVAEYLVEQLDRFGSFKNRILNTHMPILDRYRRMLAVYLPMRPHLTGGTMTLEQLTKILKASSYPKTA